MNNGHLCSKTSLTKQWPHVINFCCSVGRICLQKWKKHQGIFIISVLAKSIDDPLTKIRGASEVVKNFVSFDKLTSCLQKFLGAGKCTISPSSAWTVCPCYDGRIPSKVIEQNNFRVLCPNPCKWSCCWITESIVQFLQRWQDKGFASIAGSMDMHIPIFPLPWVNAL